MDRKTEARIEAAILRLLEQRERNATICPSEVARELFADHWRPRMDDIRRIARQLEAKGEIEILQKGRIVDSATAKGPIRLRRST